MNEWILKPIIILFEYRNFWTWSSKFLSPTHHFVCWCAETVLQVQYINIIKSVYQSITDMKSFCGNKQKLVFINHFTHSLSIQYFATRSTAPGPAQPESPLKQFWCHRHSLAMHAAAEITSSLILSGYFSSPLKEKETFEDHHFSSYCLLHLITRMSESSFPNFKTEKFYYFLN